MHAPDQGVGIARASPSNGRAWVQCNARARTHAWPCCRESWRSWAILRALSAMSSYEENRALLIKHPMDLVGVLEQATTGEHDMQLLVHRYALSICWNLSFEEAGVARLARSSWPAYAAQLQAETTAAKVRQAATGFLFQSGLDPVRLPLPCAHSVAASGPASLTTLSWLCFPG